jgi:hypothetical protein
MSDMQERPHAGGGQMTLRKALSYYGAALVISLVVAGAAMNLQWVPGWTAALVYLLIGVALNRTVLRRLIEWHPVYNTLENVAGAKLRMMLFWPATYLVLFFKLGVSKYL